MLRVRPIGPASSPGQYIYDTSPSSSTSSRPFPSSPPSTFNRHVRPGPHGVEEEIVWYDRTVLWSRGSEVHRKWTFERTGTEEEQVTWAGFVYFPPQGALPSSESGSSSSSSGGNNGVDNGSGGSSKAGTFGPFHTSQHATWGQPASSSSTTSASRPPLVRTTLICLRSKAIVYYPSGETHTIHLPFVVEKGFPLPPTPTPPTPSSPSTTSTPATGGGVVLQRRLEKREIRRLKGRQSSSILKGMETGMLSILDELDNLDEGEATLPRVYTLSNPFEELKMVVEATVVESRIIGPEQPLGYQVEVLYLAEGYPFVVAYDVHEREVVVYARHGIPVVEAEQPPRHVGPQELLAPRPSITSVTPAPGPAAAAQAALGHGARPSMPRTSSHFGGTERRVSSLASEAMDRTRRGPRVSRGGVVEPQHAAVVASGQTGELQAALDPPALPAPAPSRIKAKPRARVSMAPTATEVTTRRQSGVSNASLFRDEEPRPVLLGAAERDLRETTMMMGLELDTGGARSDVVLERIWSWKPPADVDMRSATVFLSDDISSSDRVDLNIHASSALFVFRAKRLTEWSIEPLHSTTCTAAVPVYGTRHQVLDTLILQTDGTLQLAASGRVIPLSLPRSLTDIKDELPRQLASRLSMNLDTDEDMDKGRVRRVVDIRDPVDGRISLVFEDGEKIRVSVDHRISDPLVRRCFDALTWVVSSDLAARIQFDLLAGLQDVSGSESAWEVFEQTVKTILGISTPFESPRSVLESALHSSDPIARKLALRIQRMSDRPEEAAPIPGRAAEEVEPDSASQILLALHLVAQDSRLSQKRKDELARVAQMVVDLSFAVGRSDWLDYWRRSIPLFPAPSVTSLPRQDTSILDAFDAPPDILAYLSRRLSAPLKPFPAPHRLGTSVPDNGRTVPCSATSLIISIYDRLCVSSDRPADSRSRAESIIRRAGDTITFMAELDLNHEYLYDLPPCVAMPVMELIRVCQIAPRKDWSPEVFDFVGRTDLAAQARGSVLPSRDSTSVLDEDMPTVGSIVNSVVDDKAKHTHSLPALPHVRFGSDRRLAEVERIMQTTRVRIIAIQEPKNASDADIATYQQSFVNTIANRTLSIPIGQGIFEYGTRSTTITDVFDIPLIELSVKVVPGNTTLSAQIVAEHADWPCFHNGVASALSISPDCKGIDSSWIVFNRPSVLNPEHGGFLLGLGLTGHLRSLMTYHAFPYMEPRHDFTSVGLLLGLAASFAGSEDLLITKVLSLHTHALLPLGSMELNASAVIQSTALVGLGLVYAGSKNLRMAETALAEVGRKEMGGVDGFGDYAEAYSFSASMTFGLIMLGRGGQVTSEVDRKMLAKITKNIHGSPASVDDRQPLIDTTITAPGATLALGLMYLKSGRQDVADILTIPTTAFALEHIRPDLLLLRTFARALIMWDQVAPSLGWIEAQIPSFIAHKGHKKASMLELNLELAYINIVAGACLAIGLKYAGTATEMAHNNLMFFYGVLSKAAAGQSMTYEGKIRRTAARQGLNVVTIALAVVMSGTGELNVLRRLRISHGQEGAGVTYGTHMAMHMAIGILFLGRGHYTLGSSNLAIAAMSIAFFPRFLSSPSDNKAYPQAFRHLWALAVEPRCLIARDVDTSETVYLPVKVKLNENGQVRHQSLISPTLIAPFESLLSIEVDSPRYWPITYDLSDPRDRAALVKTRTVHVKRKAGFLDYNSDPKGNRSIFVRAGSMTGFDLHYDLVSAAAPPTISSEEVVQLIEAHSGNAGLISMARHFNGDTALERAVRVVLLECVSLDKPTMVPIYLSLLLSVHSCNQIKSEWIVESLVGLGYLRKFYAGVYERDYALPSRDRQVPLVRGNTISTLYRRLADGESVDEWYRSQYWRDGSWIKGEYAKHLAIYLHTRNVPPLPALLALASKVQDDKRADETVTLVKVRDVAAAYVRNLEAQWDLVPVSSRGQAATWIEISAKEAVEVWKGA